MFWLPLQNLSLRKQLMQNTCSSGKIIQHICFSTKLNSLNTFELFCGLEQAMQKISYYKKMFSNDQQICERKFIFHIKIVLEYIIYLGM